MKVRWGVQVFYVPSFPLFFFFHISLSLKHIFTAFSKVAILQC